MNINQTIIDMQIKRINKHQNHELVIGTIQKQTIQTTKIHLYLHSEVQ